MHKVARMHELHTEKYIIDNMKGCILREFLVQEVVKRVWSVVHNQVHILDLVVVSFSLVVDEDVFHFGGESVLLGLRKFMQNVHFSADWSQVLVMHALNLDQFYSHCLSVEVVGFENCAISTITNFFK